MSRVEHIGDATLYLGDCLEVLAGFADELVDMVWTDPPYGHSNHDGDFNARLNDHRGIENAPIANDDADSMRTVVDAMLTEAARVLRADCCCCCCCCGGGGGHTQPYPEALGAGMQVNVAIDTHSNDYLENMKLAVIGGGYIAVMP